MKFRLYRSPSPTLPRRSATYEIVLDRRSAYLMTRESRQAYEHHIPPVAQLRYSVTFARSVDRVRLFERLLRDVGYFEKVKADKQ